MRQWWMAWRGYFALMGGALAVAAGIVAGAAWLDAKAVDPCSYLLKVADGLTAQERDKAATKEEMGLPWEGSEVLEILDRQDLVVGTYRECKGTK